MSDVPTQKLMKPVTRDRPRGILSQKDREYLAGETSLEPQSERRRRQLIRERVLNAIFDFWLLVDYLEDRDFEQVFDQDRELFHDDMNVPYPHLFIHDQYRLHGQSGDRKNLPPPTSKRVSTLAFEYSLVDMISFATKAADHLHGLDAAETVETGMSKYLTQFDRTASVETTDATIGVLYEKLNRGTLNPAEFQKLLELDVGKW